MRRAAAGLALLVLLVSETCSLARDELRRVNHAWKRVESRLDGAGFDFDRAYGPFLYASDGAVPSGRNIAVAAPRTNELYTYQAAYTLAPRRVVTVADQARFLATYGRSAGHVRHGARPLPGGSLSYR